VLVLSGLYRIVLGAIWHVFLVLCMLNSHTRQIVGTTCFCLMVGSKKAWIQFESLRTTLASSTPMKPGSLQRTNLKGKCCLVLHLLARKRQIIFQCCSQSHTLTAADWIAGSLAPFHQLLTRFLAISTGFIFAEKRELKTLSWRCCQLSFLFTCNHCKSALNSNVTARTASSVTFEEWNCKIW